MCIYPYHQKQLPQGFSCKWMHQRLNLHKVRLGQRVGGNKLQFCSRAPTPYRNLIAIIQHVSGLFQFPTEKFVFTWSLKLLKGSRKSWGKPETRENKDIIVGVAFLAFSMSIKTRDGKVATTCDLVIRFSKSFYNLIVKNIFYQLPINFRSKNTLKPFKFTMKIVLFVLNCKNMSSTYVVLLYFHSNPCSSRPLALSWRADYSSRCPTKIAYNIYVEHETLSALPLYKSAKSTSFEF